MTQITTKERIMRAFIRRAWARYMGELLTMPTVPSDDGWEALADPWEGRC